MELVQCILNEHSSIFCLLNVIMKPESVYDERVDNYNDVNDNCEK